MMFFNLKKLKFLRFPSFQFWPTHKIENSETCESFLLLHSLVVYGTQDPKTKKMVKDKKNITL